MVVRFAALVTLLAAGASAQLPQGGLPQGGLPQGGAARFVDFSDHLRGPKVAVVLGSLDKLRDGKRRRIKDSEAHVGSGSSVVRSSGTQYYAVPVRGKLVVGEALAGAKVGAVVSVAFEVQLARLPSGETRRQLRTAGQPQVAEGGQALWVVDRGKGGHTILQAVTPAGTKTPPGAAFVDLAHDLVAINQRLAGLKQAVDVANLQRERAPDRAVEALKGALQGEVALRDLTHDTWVTAHVGPWERRARKLLDGLGGG